MIRRKKSHLIRNIIFLFFLNFISISLYYFFFFHSPSITPSLETPSLTKTPLKPWPSLPSSLPWNPTTKPPPRSCEAYFGNGFSNRIDVHGGTPAGGWFRCFHSATLSSSVCEGGRIRMDPSRIKMSVGGEGLDSVMGRREEEELPVFGIGSFEIEGSASDLGSAGDGRAVDEEFLNRYVPRGAVHDHTMRGLMESMRIVGPDGLQCSQLIEEPTILVTRFEYANLFHTVTDWYSAYVSSKVTGLPGRPHLIFLDGHCKAPLEETWNALFSSVRYAKHFTGSVCFRHLILSPLGYETAMFKGLSERFNCQGTSAINLLSNPDNQKTARLSEFGEMLRASFGLPVDDYWPKKPSTAHNILFVRREDYLAHPRHNGKVESRLRNEPEVFAAIQSWAANHTKCSLNVVNGLFAHMSMKEQLRSIYEASVVVGAHGAGLTHLVSARSKTVVLEIISSQYQRPHFSLISQWKGLEYHAINLAGSSARPEMVIDELSSIVRSLGC